MAKLWSRRELVKVGAMAGLGSRLAMGQRMPQPRPLEDAGVGLVVTTEAYCLAEGRGVSAGVWVGSAEFECGCGDGADDGGVWRLLQ